jgi:light-harvesting complex I chlorophyll a/b binding protein 3
LQKRSCSRRLGTLLTRGCPLPAAPAGGQFFNMFNLGKTEAEMKKLKLNEIKNGRLAMLAMFGYGAQVSVVGQSSLHPSAWD